MSINSSPVSLRGSRSGTSEAAERSSSASSTSNTSRRGSASSSDAAPMSLQRTQSINIRELFNSPHPENDFYVPEVFDAMDEGMDLEEAFIQAQRAALAAINDAALARAIQESERLAAAAPRTQPPRTAEPSRLSVAPKYALVLPGELGASRNHSRSVSGSSTSSSSSGSSSSSASTAASSVLSSSIPKTAAPPQTSTPAVKSVSAPVVITASSSTSRTPYTPAKVPVHSTSAPTSSSPASRPSASPSKSFLNTTTTKPSGKSAVHQQNSNQVSPYLSSTSSASNSKPTGIAMASGSLPSRKTPAVPSSTASSALPVPIASKTATLSSASRATPTMAPQPSSSPSAKDLAMGMMSSGSPLSADSAGVQSHRRAYNIRQRLKCSRCSGSARVKCRCPLSYLLTVEQTLMSFDKDLVTLVGGGSSTTEKQRQLFFARVLLRNELATRPFESMAIKTLDTLQKALAGLKDAASPSCSDDSDSSDSPEFDCPSSLDLHLCLQSLLSASLLPSCIHFFLSHPNAQDWMKFADLYVGILTFLRRLVECGGGSILNEPIVGVDHRYPNLGISSQAASSIWDVVLARLERQTRPDLLKAATAIKFGGTMDKVNRMCDGIMWLVLQELTD